jgi:two-component system nitrogen regulation response regulator GlnG
MYDLLVIDDEPNVLYSLERGLRCETLGVRTARSGEQGMRQVRERRPDAVILDVRLPDGSGLDVYSQIRAIEPRLPVIIITAFAATETAIEAMKRGAFEYLLKPVDLHQLKEVVGRALESGRVLDEPRAAAEDDGAEPIIGRCPAMQEVYKAIGRVAPCDVPVLITGESGTGKELVA